jgi:hypothetical protein
MLRTLPGLHTICSLMKTNLAAIAGLIFDGSVKGETQC